MYLSAHVHLCLQDTLLLLLKSLPMGCYFNIYGFGSHFQSFFPSVTRLSSRSVWCGSAVCLRRCVSLQSECGVRRGHDGRGSEESEEHERRHGRHGDPRAAETHLQSAVLPGSPPTGTAHPHRPLQTNTDP